LIDSVINGVLSFIGLRIINVPYALLISIIIAVTNMVPYFGAFLGGAIAALIVLFSQPNIMLVVWTIAFDVLIQQLDSWLIAPKILENQMGISPILIIAGITVGGSLFGFMGMILGVPLVAVIKEIFYDDYIMNKIRLQRAHKAAAEESKTD
jgi:predicted PurR-regulated permease PerM